MSSLQIHRLSIPTVRYSKHVLLLSQTNVLTGGTNYKGQIIFAGEGQGDRITSALYLMNPLEPYNTTGMSFELVKTLKLACIVADFGIAVLVNNFFGRQFNSLNDVTVNPRNKDVYFTDTLYGFYQYFRPVPGLRNQVYRLNPTTGALTVVADDFVLPNGKSIALSMS